MRHIVAFTALSLLFQPHSVCALDTLEEGSIEQNLAYIEHIEGDLAHVFDNLDAEERDKNDDRMQISDNKDILDSQDDNELAEKIGAEIKVSTHVDAKVLGEGEGMTYGDRKGGLDYRQDGTEVEGVSNNSERQIEPGSLSIHDIPYAAKDKSEVRDVVEDDILDRDTIAVTRTGEKVIGRVFKFESSVDDVDSNVGTNTLDSNKKGESGVEVDNVDPYISANGVLDDTKTEDDGERHDEIVPDNVDLVGESFEKVQEDSELVEAKDDLLQHDSTSVQEKVDAVRGGNEEVQENMDTREEARAAGLKAYTEGDIYENEGPAHDSDAYHILSDGYITSEKIIKDVNMDWRDRSESDKSPNGEQQVTVHDMVSEKQGDDFNGDLLSESIAMFSFGLSIAVMMSILYTIVSRSTQRRTCTTRAMDLESGGRKFSLM